jgi:uncharacterized protein YidB (DUF937 family)
MPEITQMLGTVGLTDLKEKFSQSGIGHIFASWIAKGPNQAVSPDQLDQVLGAGKIKELADKAKVSVADARASLAQLLPNLVDKLTPDGQIPSGNLQQRLKDLMASGGLGKLFGQEPK